MPTILCDKERQPFLPGCTTENRSYMGEVEGRSALLWTRTVSGNAILATCTGSFWHVNFSNLYRRLIMLRPNGFLSSWCR
eukprot:g42960.t1